VLLLPSSIEGRTGVSSSKEQGDVAAAGGIPYDSRRQADLYWRQIEQLKAAAVCIRLYRNQLAGRVRAVEIIKAVASSGAIAGWFAFDAYKLLWGCIIAAAQLLDVLKDVFPFAKLHKQAANLTVALEFLLIDAEDEWEKIHIGKIDDATIIERRTRLRKLQLEAEQKHFPEGFEPPPKLVALATEEARTYFLVTYNLEAKP
jgi:hypothetical protein